MRRTLNLLSLILLAAGILTASSYSQEWTRFTEKDGLIYDSVLFIKEDARGYLWFITEFHGVTRYDGDRFHSYRSLNTPDSLASDNINFTLPDSKGNIWFGSDRGASRFDGESFLNLNTAGGLIGDYLTFILEDSRGYLWFATDRGVSRFDGTAISSLEKDDGLLDNSIHCMLEDRANNLWFGTQKGVCRYDGDEFHVVSPSNFNFPIQTIYEDRHSNIWLGAESGAYIKKAKSSSVEGPIIAADVKKIEEDQSGYIWFVTNDQGVHRYDMLSGTSTAFLRDAAILSLLEDSRGDLWLGTDIGIFRYEGRDFQNFSQLHNLDLGFVWTIYEDLDQNLWFASDNGLWRYTLEDLKVMTEDDGLAHNSIETMLEDSEGRLWFGTTGNGVSRYDRTAFETLSINHGLVDDSILSLFEDSRGNMWIGTSSGVSRSYGSLILPVREESLENAVRCILEDETSKDLWFAAPDGLVRFDGEAFYPHSVRNGSSMIIDRSGSVWLGSWSDGLFRYDGKRWMNYTISDGLGSNHITWMLETHDRNIWYGFEGSGENPEGGIGRFDGSEFTVFTARNGLASTNTTVGFEDNRGDLWIGTEDRGIIKYSGSDEAGSPRFENLTITDGLISNRVTAIHLDRSWNLWFGTDEGVSKYDGENFQNIQVDLTLGRIHTLYEDHKGYLWFVTSNDGVIRYVPSAKEICPRVHITYVEGDRIYHNVSSLRMPSTTKRISFEFKGISFRTEPEEMKYFFRLEGFDEEWSAATHETRVHYRDVGPGSYRFSVRALDRDLHKSNPPAAVDIEIFRPWFLTPQFIFSIILGGLALLGGGGYLIVQFNNQRRTAVRLREKLQMQEETERIQTAKMRSLRQLVAGVAHEINNPIGVISSSIDTSNRSVRRIRSILHERFSQEACSETDLNKILELMEDTCEAGGIASQRVGSVVTDLRTFVGLDEAEWRLADIHEGIDSSITLLGLDSSSRTDIHRDYGQIPGIFCCPSSLNQTFMCILRNASEAIEEHGEIRIKTGVRWGCVKIEISDTGRGIRPENLDRIFDPGFTTKSVGVGIGLGLAICHKIIKDEHRGRIDVESELGKGTTFSFSLPITEKGKACE